MSALNVFALCLLAGLLWLSGELARWEVRARERCVRAVSLGLLLTVLCFMGLNKRAARL